LFSSSPLWSQKNFFKLYQVLKKMQPIPHCAYANHQRKRMDELHLNIANTIWNLFLKELQVTDHFPFTIRYPVSASIQSAVKKLLEDQIATETTCGYEIKIFEYDQGKTLLLQCSLKVTVFVNKQCLYFFFLFIFFLFFFFFFNFFFLTLV
jgi:hypothetical protein